MQHAYTPTVEGRLRARARARVGGGGYPEVTGTARALTYGRSYSRGGPAAHMEYDPFGNLLPTSTGAFADFPHKFSTKYTDTATGLLYHGYRWLDPLTGRWPSRHPIGERGSVNLYGFVGNNVVNDGDFLGAVVLRLHLVRQTQRNFGIYGTITLSSADQELSGCCGLPITKLTIEQPERKTKGSGPIRHISRGNGRLRRDGIPEGQPEENLFNTSPNALSGDQPSARPEEMNSDDYYRAISHEINTGYGGINVHAGTDAS